MTNLKQIAIQDKQRAFQVPTSPREPIKSVVKAMYKFLPANEVESIIDGFRRSAFSVDALMQDIASLNVPDHKVIRDNVYQWALDETERLFRPPKLCKPVHYNDLRQYPWTLDSSVELPFSRDPSLCSQITRKFSLGELPHRRMSFGNLFEYVFRYNRPIVHLIKDGNSQGHKFYYNMTAHARSHLVESGDPDKIRLVYGVPKIIVQVELMFLWQFTAHLREGTTPIAWGYETMNGGMYRLINDLSSWSYRSSTILCLDWSQFDKRMKFEQIRDIHKIIRNYLDFENGYVRSVNGPLSNTASHRLSNLWNWMCKAITDAPLLLPDGSIVKRQHSSLASGLFQTQILDSMVNVVMLLSCLKDANINTDNLYIKVLGDDSVIGIREYIRPSDHESFLEKLALSARRRFGAILNAKKSIVVNSLEGIHFLGYHSDHSLPVRPRSKLLAQLAYPERHWTPERVMSRAIGIAYASVGCDKVVYDICYDVYQHCVSLGCKPDSAGLAWMLSLFKDTDIDLSRFPSFSEISERLILSSNSNFQEQKKKFWNPDFFLE